MVEQNQEISNITRLSSLSVLFHQPQNMAVFGGTQPTMLFAALTFSTHQLASQYHLNAVYLNIAELITPNVFGRAIHEGGVIGLLLNLHLVVFSLFFLQF